MKFFFQSYLLNLRMIALQRFCTVVSLSKCCNALDCRNLRYTEIKLLFIFRIDSYPNAAARGKFRAYFAPAWLERGYQIIKHYIGDVFVENAFIAERP